jgi:hypothetical protein
MFKVGESADRFDQIWPGKRPHKSNKLKRLLQYALLVSRRALLGATRLAEWSLQWKCPNPFMSYVLGCYFRTGYDAHARMRRSQQKN